MTKIGIEVGYDDGFTLARVIRRPDPLEAPPARIPQRPADRGIAVARPRCRVERGPTDIVGRGCSSFRASHQATTGAATTVAIRITVILLIEPSYVATTSGGRAVYGLGAFFAARDSDGRRGRVESSTPQSMPEQKGPAGSISCGPRGDPSVTSVGFTQTTPS